MGWGWTALVAYSRLIPGERSGEGGPPPVTGAPLKKCMDCGLFCLGRVGGGGGGWKLELAVGSGDDL